MSVVVAGRNSFHIGAQAFLLDDNRETAWAEHHIKKHPTIRYLVGRYVEADNANSNGHVFPLAGLEAAKEHIAHTPLNMLHRPNYIVGHYVAAELMYPTEAAAGGDNHPHVEALAAFYRYYFPEEFAEVEKAHKDGLLFYSMECVPRSLTCGACTQEYAYDGRQSASYCDHLNEPAAIRTLNEPNFTGGALIIPPVRPGWKRADVTEVSKLLSAHDEEAERLYQEVAHELPHADAEQWERVVAQLILAGYQEAEGGEWAKDFSSEKRKRFAKSGVARPDGSYPIQTVGDLSNAIQAFGRAKPADRAAVKAHILRRARALNAMDKIPDSWS